MPLLRVEAEKLSNNDLQRGIVEEIIDREALFNVLPFVRTEGKAYVYNREKTLAEGDFLDPNETVNESASDFTEVVAKLKILIGDVDVDKFLNSTMSDTNPQVSAQLAAKAKGMGRKFRRTLAIGDEGSNAKEFSGIKALTDAGQIFSAGANGGALTFEMLDELMDYVPNGADAIFMRPGTFRAYRQLHYALGGTKPEQIAIENFGSVPAHNGVPILMNEFLPGNETQGSNNDTCSIYAARLNEFDGLHGIYGGETGDVLKLEPLGTVQNKDAWRYRMKMYAGTALKSTKSLASLTGVTNI